jgi:hypothetical protein
MIFTPGPFDPEPEQEVAEALIERPGRGAVAVRGRARLVAQDLGGRHDGQEAAGMQALDGLDRPRP